VKSAGEELAKCSKTSSRTPEGIVKPYVVKLPVTWVQGVYCHPTNEDVVDQEVTRGDTSHQVAGVHCQPV